MGKLTCTYKNAGKAFVIPIHIEVLYINPLYKHIISRSMMAQW